MAGPRWMGLDGSRLADSPPWRWGRPVDFKLGCNPTHPVSALHGSMMLPASTASSLHFLISSSLVCGIGEGVEGVEGPSAALDLGR
jgi:hypothetical protein